MKFKSIKKIYEGKFLSYYIADFINRDGNIKAYEFISRDKNITEENFGKNKPVGVGSVAFNVGKTKILLQKEFRPATNRWIFNFPAGLIDKGEDAVSAIKRELKEETGVDLVKVDAVLSPSYASQGTSDELMQIVICECEGEIVNSSFADEEIVARWYTKEEVKELLDDGEYMSVRTQMFLWQWANNL